MNAKYNIGLFWVDSKQTNTIRETNEFLYLLILLHWPPIPRGVAEPEITTSAIFIKKAIYRIATTAPQPQRGPHSIHIEHARQYATRAWPDENENEEESIEVNEKIFSYFR